MYKFKMLLEQISNALFDKIANVIFAMQHKKYINSIFSVLNTNFKKALSFLREKGIDIKGSYFNYSYERNKSFNYAEKLKEKLESKFGPNICFSKKFNPDYAFFEDDRKFIPYLRLTIVEDVMKLGLIDKEDLSMSIHKLEWVIEHDDVEYCIRYEKMKTEKGFSITYPAHVPIFYAKIRPFVIGNKRMIVIEEMQSTLIAFPLRGKEEEFQHVIQLIKKYLSSVINLLYENCDALYIVRTAVPRNQRFLYEDYEKFRCGNPFRNEKFGVLISPIVVSENWRYELNTDYEYLYCLKEIPDSELKKLDVYSLIGSYISTKLKAHKKFDLIIGDNLRNSNLYELFLNLFSQELDEIKNKFKNEINKVRISDFEQHLRVYDLEYSESDNTFNFLSHIKFKLCVNIELNETGISEKLALESFDLSMKKKFRRIHRRLVKLITAELKNQNILGVIPHSEIISKKTRYRSKRSNDVKTIYYYLISDIVFNIKFSLRDILRRVGIKNV